MAPPHYQLLRGDFIILGKRPDGDSIRFVPDKPELLSRLWRSHRINLNREDGSVQLRFEGVDAPEVHFGYAAQPLGAEARSALLSWLGFTKVVVSLDEHGLVISAEPERVRGAILTHGADQNGRPISYLLLEDDINGLEETDWIYMSEELVRKTVNCHMLSLGVAYPLVYTSTPYAHRQYLRTVAAKARSAGLGIWTRDVSNNFLLVDQNSINEKGQLIFPKLFRRCTHYLEAVRGGFRGNLVEWLISTGKGGQPGENDLIVVEEKLERHLSELLLHDSGRVTFNGDLLNIAFVEK